MKQFHIPTALLAALTLLAPSLYGGHVLAAEQEQAAPQGEDAPGADNGAKPPLAQEDGVIKPPPIGDEDIQAQVPDPNAGHPEEVIPPPGSPGGNPNIDPR